MKRLPLAAIFALLLAGAFLRHGNSQSNFTQQLAPGVYYRAADRPKNIIANTGWIVCRDSIAYLPKEKILFTGDLCVNFAGNNIADPDADPANWLRVLDDLSQKDVGVLIPGHGGKGSSETLRGQRAYLADMIGGVRNGIEKGVPAEQLAKDLDLSVHNPWGKDPVRNATSIKAVYAKLNRSR